MLAGCSRRKGKILQGVGSACAKDRRKDSMPQGQATKARTCAGKRGVRQR